MSTVTRAEDGTWEIVDDDGGVIQGGFRTNAEAWKYFDRHDRREVAAENVRRSVSYHFGRKMG